MKKKENKSRIENKASHTALMAAIHRFNATKENREGFVGPDDLAKVFLPSKAKFFLSRSFFRRVFINKLHEKVPGTYEYVTARTMFFDEVFYESLMQKTPQIVFLGAGYDTRALRFQRLTNHTTIYELDAPSTQNEKKKRLKQNNIPLPENLVFVPINFNTDNLGKALIASGYDPGKRTLFIWEGVTMYITPGAVNKTLSFIKHNSGEGSSIVFDYFYESVINGTCTSYGADKLAESVGELSEHFRFGIEEGKAEELLEKSGFSLIDHYSPQEFEETYLKDDAGKLFGKMYGFAGHIYAKLNTMRYTFFNILLGSILLLLSACDETDRYAPMEALTGNVKYDTTGSSLSLNVASVAMQCNKLAENNILTMENFIEKIVTDNPEVELIVFGELILGWYEDPDDQESYHWDLAETIPGPTTDRIAELATKYKVHITFGMSQLLDGKLYNAQPVIGPDGTLLATHHKTRLTPADLDAGFELGNELTVFDINGVTCGLIVCKDQENSYLTRDVVKNNCKVLIISFADDVVEDFFGFGSSLSRKYSAWLVSSNRFGDEGDVFYKGEIRVSDPGGNHHIRKENSEQYLYYSIPIHE